MKRYLAFFGAFNPPTNAHILLSERAAAETGAEKVLFVPSKSRYIRDVQGKDFAYSGERRLAMLQRAAETRPFMEVWDVELRAPEQPRTYHTLCRLREAGRDSSLLLGSDKLPELEHGWLYADRIAGEFGIVVLTRGGDECGRMIRESAFLSGIAGDLTVIITPEETRGISSSAVRRLVMSPEDRRAEIAAMVPEEIIPLLTPETE